jgi:molecular chaperone GrpE (heat shock protein)
MNEESMPETSAPKPAARPGDNRPLASSSLFRLTEELIALRETTKNQLRLFERQLVQTRDDLFDKFSRHVAEQHQAYQDLRKEIHGEKRVGLKVLNELLDIFQDLERIVAAKPAVDDKAAVARWIESVEVEARKVQEVVRQHGIHPYDAVAAAPYNPALHERIGSMKKEGLGPLHVAEQRERGWASQQPEFVLRRPKVIVSE